MKYPTLKLCYDRRGKAVSQKGSETPGAVEIEIYFERKRKWISTGVSVVPSQWNNKSGMVVGNPDCGSLNLRINAQVKPIREYINGLMARGEEFSFEDIERELSKQKLGVSFRDYVERKIESRSDIQGVTKRNHKRLLNALDGFKKIRTFDDLNPRKIREFDEWLHTQGYTQTTVACYHKFMKNYIHLAMADELIASDPYVGIRIERGKPKDRKYLTDSELEMVRGFHTLDPSTERARDMFMFQCFTGLAYADMAKFDFEKVEERNKKFVIRDARQKTGEDYYIVLLSPAMEILRKYDMKLPLISNQKYNSALKAVAAGAGLKRTLTSHMGRHTFATYCLNHGISLETLAPMMGHSSIKSTQIYAKMINKTVESAFDKLEEELG